MCQKDERGCPGHPQRSMYFPFSCNECSVYHYTPSFIFMFLYLMFQEVEASTAPATRKVPRFYPVMPQSSLSSSTGSNTVFSASCTEPPCMCHKKHVHHYLTVHHGYEFSTKRTASHYSARQSSTTSQQCPTNSVFTVRKPRTATEQEKAREINKR